VEKANAQSNQKFLVFSLDDVRNSKSSCKGNTSYKCVKDICYNLEKSFGRALRRTSAPRRPVEILTSDLQHRDTDYNNPRVSVWYLY